MTKKPQWNLPEPHSIHEVALDTATTSTLRRHGNTQGRRILLSHGNGLAIDAYYAFWSQLEDEFDLVVYDLRNHGWNTVSSQENHNVHSLVKDLSLILDAIDTIFGEKPIVGVFHSLSALIALLLSSDLLVKSFGGRSRGFDGLVLFDPPLHSPGKDLHEFDQAVENTARKTRARSPRFSSKEQFVELLKFFPTYSRVVEGTTQLIAESTLRYDPSDKSYHLRCPPEYEAQVTEFIRAYAGQVDFSTLSYPLKIIGADPVLPFSYLPTLDLSDMLNIDFDFLPDTTHFLQMERPVECANQVRDFINRLNS